MKCHRRVKRFVFFGSTPPRHLARGTTPSFPSAVLSPPGGRTRSQGRSQPARTQAPAGLRTRGHRRSGNGSRDLEGAASQVRALARWASTGSAAAPQVPQYRVTQIRSAHARAPGGISLVVTAGPLLATFRAFFFLPELLPSRA
jgi:hypothetical protein